MAHFNKEHLQWLLDANGFHDDCLLDAHHVEHRSQGGTDTIKNCVLIPRHLHDNYHNDPDSGEEDWEELIYNLFRKQQDRLRLYCIKHDIDYRRL